jgi:hypothetical protein
MGNICFPKYQYYIKIKNCIASLLKKNKIWDISENDMNKLTDIVEEAEIHCASDISSSDKKKRKLPHRKETTDISNIASSRPESSADLCRGRKCRKEHRAR